MSEKEQEKKESEPKSTPLKFYIAGPFSEREEVRELMDKIKTIGHEIIYDWTDHLPVSPFEENQDLARRYANEDAEGAAKCDIFVLFPGKKGGTMRFVELGIAIKSPKVNRVFVVGPFNNRSISFFHPKVERVASEEEVFEIISQLKAEEPLLTSR